MKGVGQKCQVPKCDCRDFRNGHGRAAKSEAPLFVALSKMALADVKPGTSGRRLAHCAGCPDSKVVEFDYSHLLPGGSGLTLSVGVHPHGGSAKQSFTSTARLPDGTQVGYVKAGVSKDVVGGTGKKSIQPHSLLDDKYHGKGIGKAMYEALLAHAKRSGVDRVQGVTHTPAASRVHASLAAKHGLDYVPVKSEGSVDAFGKPLTEDKKWLRNYEYELKSERAALQRLSKMALSDVHPSSTKVPAGRCPDCSGGTAAETDYSHLAPAGSGVSIRVSDHPHGRRGRSILSVVRNAAGAEVGSVEGRVAGDNMEPHSKLARDFQGRGIGSAMYEALFAHARRAGVKTVQSWGHTPAAAKVHEKLSAKHGLSYRGLDHPDSDGGYEYELKSEPVYHRGVGEGSDLGGFQWHSEDPALAQRYADHRGGAVTSARVAVQKPFLVPNGSAVLSARSVFAQAATQASATQDKTAALAARGRFLAHFGDGAGEMTSYWSSPEAKERTRDLLESLGFDGIHMREAGVNTVASFRPHQIVASKAEALSARLELALRKNVAAPGVGLTTALLDEGTHGWVAGSGDLTRRDIGRLDPRQLVTLPGQKGEHKLFARSPTGRRTPGEWKAFVDDIRRKGVESPVAIHVERDGSAAISEGNHRVRAAVEAGHTSVPVEVSYFGNSQRRGELFKKEPIFRWTPKLADKQAGEYPAAIQPHSWDDGQVHEADPRTLKPTDHLAAPDNVPKLIAHIRARKPLPPIYVSEDGDILDGHHRHAAAMRMGLRSVPTIRRSY